MQSEAKHIEAKQCEAKQCEALRRAFTKLRFLSRDPKQSSVASGPNQSTVAKSTLQNSSALRSVERKADEFSGYCFENIPLGTLWSCLRLSARPMSSEGYFAKPLALTRK